MPLPQDRGRRGDARPRVHRFRSHWLELGGRLRAFRERHGLRQAEIARVLGVAIPTLCQWETGAAVAKGLPRERLGALLEGRLWPELRASIIEGDAMPSRWNQGVRWYRRASRERAIRQHAGAVVAAILEELRKVDAHQSLRGQYVERDGRWVRVTAEQRGLAVRDGVDVRRIEDAAFGLRWLELAHGLRLDLRRSLVPQLPLRLLDKGRDDPSHG